MVDIDAFYYPCHIDHYYMQKHKTYLINTENDKNSVSGALVKIINIEILFWNVFIQCLENIKSYFITINFIFYFHF
jgi:hypothetical protein